MKKLLVLSSLVTTMALIACAVTDYNAPISTHGVNIISRMTPRLQDEKTMDGPGVRPEDVFTVKIEFVLFEDEVQAYPGLVTAFLEAISDWVDVLPIEVMIAVEEDGLLHSVLGARRRIISVHFEDIQARPGLEDTLMIGFWLLDQSLLVMDTDYLVDKPELAKHVALHEIGHVFGLPHITEQGTLFSSAGDITLPLDFMPKSFLMYPAATPESTASVISQLEISMAREYVLHEMTKPGGPTGDDYFCEH